MFLVQHIEFNWELHITAAHDVLYLEVFEFYFKPQFLNHSSVFLCCCKGSCFIFGPCANDFSYKIDFLTIFFFYENEPEWKIRAVVFGSRNLIITAANLFGLYSAFLHWSAIFLRSRLQLKFTVETTFLWKMANDEKSKKIEKKLKYTKK